MLDDVHTRAATVAPASFDPEAQTIEATISTFADVPRRDGQGAHLERLDPAGLNASGLIGAPLLDGHRQGAGRDMIGTVEAVRFDGGKLVATIRLTRAADAAPLVARITEGTLKGVSVGYTVARWVETTDPQTRQRVRTAAVWSINEVSAVPIPADPGAHFRSNHMLDDTQPDPATAEMTRRAEIRALVRSAGLSVETADSLIDAGADITRAKAEVFDAVQPRAAARPIIRAHVGASADDPAVIARRQADALAFRMAGGTPAEEIKPYVAESMLDMTRGALTRAGQSVRGLSADEVFTRAAHTTSDFPLVVSNAMNKVALDSYAAAASPLKALARQRTLPNFKASTSIRLGEVGRLEPLAENGEITATSRAENGESFNLRTFARRIDVTRELLINDDLGLLGDLTRAFGEAAAATEADIMVNLLLSNPNLSDGTPVFHSTRGNVGTADANPDVASLDAARKAMRAVKGLDGKTLVAVTPKYLLVGPELETTAEAFLASIYAAATEDVNPFSGKLTLMVEPRITDDRWFVFADPARLPCLQYGYLSSAQGVQIQRQDTWNTLGISYRAFLDFGASWMDWRGAYLVPAA
jgi:HK97 family phage prohead protease